MVNVVLGDMVLSELPMVSRELSRVLSEDSQYFTGRGGADGHRTTLT